MEDNNLQPELNIELNDEVAQGVYSNLVIISHSSSEFVLDFIRVMPGMPKAQVKTRTILTAEHAKRLLMALQDNVEKYEQHFGEIRIKEMEPAIQMPFSSSSNGQA
jgi:hypothetical protein